ncbi:FHA domain-containing protein [Verrucomicrobiota bacterium]
MAFLIGMTDSIKGEKFEIKRDRTTIGRNHNNNIVLNDGAISSQHCYISHRGGHYILHDLNSTNGTKVNSKLVTEAELAPKHVLQIGSLELMFDGDSTELPGVTTTANAKVVVDGTSTVSTPESFSSVSPFGRRDEQEKASWLVVIVIAAVLALIGLVLFIYKIL